MDEWLTEDAEQTMGAKTGVRRRQQESPTTPRPPDYPVIPRLSSGATRRTRTDDLLIASADEGMSLHTILVCNVSYCTKDQAGIYRLASACVAGHRLGCGRICGQVVGGDWTGTVSGLLGRNPHGQHCFRNTRAAQVGFQCISGPRFFKQRPTAKHSAECRTDELLSPHRCYNVAHTDPGGHSAGRGHSL